MTVIQEAPHIKAQPSAATAAIKAAIPPVSAIAANVQAAVPEAPMALIKAAVSTEINRIEGQLSLMVAGVENHYESEYSFVKANWGKISAIVIPALAAAFAAGHFVKF